MYNYDNVTTQLKPEEIIMYLRKSRSDDPTLTVEEVLSKHESRLDEWSARNLSGLVPKENRFKEVVSGESIADRPEFKKILRLIESKEIKAVLVIELARLGRPDTAEIGLLSKIFRFTNTLVITPERTFNVADEFEREMFESTLKMGNFYLEYTKKVLSRGREISVTSGNFICSRPPYGYDKTIVVENGRKCPTLTINEEQANVVRMIFTSFVHENIGTQAIADRLNDLNILSPRGKQWTPDAIRTILENPVYTGMVRWNTRKAMYVVRDGEFCKTRPKTPDGEYILTKGRHQAIISEELFDAAQEKRGRTHKTCRNRELRNPLASLLYCECGKPMSYRHSTRGNLKYRTEPRLVCNGQKYCQNGSCSVDEVVDYVAEVLARSVAEFEREVTDPNADAQAFHERHLADLENRLTELNAKEISLWEEQISPKTKMPPNVFATITAKLTKEREEIEATIEQVKKKLATPSLNEVKLVNLKQALVALRDPNVSVAEKNHFLKACIDRVEYKRGKGERLVGKGHGKRYEFPPIYLDVKLKV